MRPTTRIYKPFFFCYDRHRYTRCLTLFGGVAEWSNASVLKTEVRSRGPEVRILSPPPERKFIYNIFMLGVTYLNEIQGKIEHSREGLFDIS